MEKRQDNFSVLPKTTDFGGAFYQCVFRATKRKLIAWFGEPKFQDSNSDNKVQNEWALCVKTKFSEEPIPFSLYDWKEYRDFCSEEEIEWHIGTRNAEESELVRNELYKRDGKMGCVKIVSVDMLKKFIEKGETEFFIHLGFCRSSKDITYDNGVFYIYNEIDDSETEVKEEDLLTSNSTNVGQAMRNGNFYAYDY